ncbi:MAG: DUF488 domain-containing protein [bacterium]
MLFKRQQVLLTLLDAIGSPVGHTDFQKLLFLFTLQCETVPSYEFVPYRFGGFSFTSYADKRKLIEKGFLADDDQNWILTDSGRAVARKQAVEPLRAVAFCRQHAKLRGSSLIVEQYRRFPYYASRSEILEKLHLDTDTLASIAAAKPKKSGAGLLTIGYEGRSLEGYLNELLRASVTVLCDVRRNALSRKYGFSKGTLGKACEGVGIRYEHLPELGIASDERQELDSQVDYDTLFATYARTTLPGQPLALTRIRGWVAAGERVALTCYERLPAQCHRHCVADALAQMGGPLKCIKHL